MNFITVSGNKIPWAFVMRVRRTVGGDWDVTQDVFWKARNVKGGPRGVIAYITAGFKKPASGAVPYNLQPSKERENGRMETIREWWNTSVYVTKHENGPMSMKDIFAAIAAGKE